MFSEDIQALYQEMIVEHGRSPRHFGELSPCDHAMEGVNPICGDQLKVYVRGGASHPLAVQFTGHGCAISMAATSLLLETIQNKTDVEVLQVVEAYRQMLMTEATVDEALLGKLIVLQGVRAYPSRIKCATLGCHALKIALTQTDVDAVSTEIDE